MAFTNFTGPVRSDEGFEQLVDGVWTPVGSGGGSGSALIAPIDGTLNLNFTEVGQIITVIGNGNEGMAYTLTSTCPLAVTQAALVEGRYLYGGMGVDPAGYNGSFPLTVPGGGSFFLQFALIAVISNEGTTAPYVVFNGQCPNQINDD
jgi:hypothetical protein